MPRYLKLPLTETMSMRLQQTLISARFLATFGHFIALLTLFSTIEENVSIGLADSASSADREDAMNSAWSALIFAFFCFLLDFSGLFFGTTLFYTNVRASPPLPPQSP